MVMFGDIRLTFVTTVINKFVFFKIVRVLA